MMSSKSSVVNSWFFMSMTEEDHSVTDSANGSIRVGTTGRVTYLDRVMADMESRSVLGGTFQISGKKRRVHLVQRTDV